MSTAAELAQEDVNTSKTMFGFWVYIMTDCILFASLFAAYAVLHNNTFGGPGAQELFSPPYILTETLMLLTSSYTCGLAILGLRAGKKQQLLFWLGVTFVLGLAFLGMEIKEFSHLYNEGNSWRRSGFLSAFFTLVGTHGLHITTGLLWMSVMAVKVWRVGINQSNAKRLLMLSLFWHFLDIVWIFIFTIVFMLGVI